MSFTERSIPLFGADGLEKLNNASVIVFGAGGVGAACIEALARCGVGRIGIVDCDTVSESNINRQLIATSDTVGKKKTESAKSRVLSINPECAVDIFDLFYSAESAVEVDLSEYDYIADCIDTVSAKLHLIKTANALGVPVISAMGTGNRLDMSCITVKDIYSTEGCPLARVMRKELRRIGVESLKVVCSDEKAGDCFDGRNENDRATPSSAVFVPVAAGLRMAQEIVRYIVFGE